MRSRRAGLALLGVSALGGCAVVPNNPGVMALPGTGMSFERFRADEAECRQYAQYQTGITPGDAAAQSAVASAAVGTIVGAAAGAAIDGQHGAAWGAGTGLAAGTLAGTGAAYGSAYAVQRHYDTAYVQCMYSAGHRVPGSIPMTAASAYHRNLPPPPAGYRPPPPRGLPPGPPPDL